MRTTTVVAFVLVFAGRSVFAGDPGLALQTGRRMIADRNCRAAIGVLQDAVPDAVSLADEKQRLDAMAAIHFYTALAFTQCDQAAKAKEQLREFFRLHPGQSKLDPSKYSTAFLNIFNETQQAASTSTVFDRFYPGFNEFADLRSEPLPLDRWGTNPAFLLLAASEERDAWGRLHDDVTRAEFITTFWKRHTPKGDQDEFRREIERRVAFADKSFAPIQEARGSMTDRGRVFVLLGPPARIHRHGLQRYDTTFAQRRIRTPLTGTMESWVYFRPQLPSAVPADQVEFKFVTQPGYDAVLQKDFMPLKTLAEAGGQGGLRPEARGLANPE